MRRIKSANSLISRNDPEIMTYNKEELLKLLKDRRYHSPEMSETDEDNSSKRLICVYDLSWRSDQVRFQFSVLIV